MIGDPQTFNRYTYVQNDPVNLIDPSGLYEACVHQGMTNFLAKLAGYSDSVASKLGQYAGGGKGGADSFKYAATNPINFIKGIFGRGPSAKIHFASEATLAKNVASLGSDIAAGDNQHLQAAGFTLHSIEDVHGAHMDYGLPFGHLKDRHAPDRLIGDPRFMRAANEVFRVLSGNPNASLTSEQTNQLIDAIIAACGKSAKNLKITRPPPTGGGGGGVTSGGGVGTRCTPYFWVWSVMMRERPGRL